jgi:hypothetical protein
MKKPNFFIIGAPKCGTTSMAIWLSKHPKIFISPIKEPNYFNSDLDKGRNRKLNNYEALFKSANNSHLAVGEASVFYLYSKVAVPNILKYTTNVKLIVMLRNPTEMVHSLHEQLVFSANEHLKDFKEAWRLQEKRKQGLYISKWCIEPEYLQYGSVCKLGEQLERLYTLIPQKKLLIVLLDDVKEDPRQEYLRVLHFLGIPDDGRAAFPIENRAKVRRSLVLRKIVKSINLAKRRLKIPRLATGITKKIDRFNLIEKSRKPLPKELKEELIEYFREDINKLEQLINRDLSHWLG